MRKRIGDRLVYLVENRDGERRWTLKPADNYYERNVHTMTLGAFARVEGLRPEYYRQVLLELTPAKAEKRKGKR